MLMQAATAGVLVNGRYPGPAVYAPSGVYVNVEVSESGRLRIKIDDLNYPERWEEVSIDLLVANMERGDVEALIERLTEKLNTME